VLSARYLDIAPLYTVYTTSCYTTTMSVARGNHSHQNISIPKFCPHFANFTKGSYYRWVNMVTSSKPKQ